MWFFGNTRHLLLLVLVTTSKALVTRSKALVPSSFLLLLVRHLLLEAMHWLYLSGFICSKVGEKRTVQAHGLISAKLHTRNQQVSREVSGFNNGALNQWSCCSSTAHQMIMKNRKQSSPEKHGWVNSKIKDQTRSGAPHPLIPCSNCWPFTTPSAVPALNQQREPEQNQENLGTKRNM